MPDRQTQAGQNSRADLARRVADCLEQHLHDYGWQPYRYPSGEHKGVSLAEYPEASEVELQAADGFRVVLVIYERRGSE